MPHKQNVNKDAEIARLYKRDRVMAPNRNIKIVIMAFSVSLSDTKFIIGQFAMWGFKLKKKMFNFVINV